jgi:hypothetical protein
MADGDDLFGTRDRLVVSDNLVRSNPHRLAAAIECQVCQTETARLCAIRLRDGLCTVTYRCTSCMHVEDLFIP